MEDATYLESNLNYVKEYIEKKDIVLARAYLRMACDFGATPEQVSEHSGKIDAAEEQAMKSNKETAYLSMAEVYFYEGNNEEARRYLNLLKEMNAQNTVSITRDMDEAERILKEFRQVQAQVFQKISLKYEYFPLHHCTKVDWEFVMKYVDFEPIKYLALAEENYAKRNFDEARQNLTRAKDLKFWSEADKKLEEYTKAQIVKDAIKAVQFTECYSSSPEEIEDAIKMYTKAATAAEVLNYSTIKNGFAIKAALLRNELAILKAKLLQEENCSIEESIATIPLEENKSAYLKLTETFFYDDNIGEAKRFLAMLKETDLVCSQFSSQIKTIENKIKDAAEIRRNLDLCQEQIFNRITEKHKNFPIHFCIKVDWKTVLKYVNFKPAKILAIAQENYVKRDFRLAEITLIQTRRSMPLGYEYRNDEVPVMDNEGLALPVKDDIIIDIINAATTEEKYYSNLTHDQWKAAKEMYLKACKHARIIEEKELGDRFAENENVITSVFWKQDYYSLWDLRADSKRLSEDERRPARTGFCSIQ